MLEPVATRGGKEMSQTADATLGLPGRGIVFLRAAAPWISFLVTRLIRLVIVFLLVSLATLGMIQLLPGGPAVAILGTSATPGEIKVINAQLGLNQSFFHQYMNWISGLLHGNFGRSTFSKQLVSTILKTR